MSIRKLNNLTLINFDKENKEHLEFLKKLIHDESIKKWFNGICSGLINNPNNEFFGHSFFVKDNEDLVGYVNIGDFNTNEKSVYLRSAVEKNKRGKNYGKTILSDITDYIFDNFNEVESIRLKIDRENKASLMTANACGYLWLTDDFYYKSNPNIKKK